jgi:Mn2+/Fe2+ NRAMP family transporter
MGGIKRPVLAWLLLAIGFGLTIAGCAAQFRSRTNFEDDLSWLVWGIGMSLIGAAVALYFTRRGRLSAVLVMAIAVVSIVTPLAMFTILVVAYWGHIVLRILLRF